MGIEIGAVLCLGDIAALIHIELPTSICDVGHNIGSNPRSGCSTIVTANCACELGSCPSIRWLDARQEA